MTSTFDLLNLFNAAGQRFLKDADRHWETSEIARQQQDTLACEREARIAQYLENQAEGLFETARWLRAEQTEPARVPPTPLPDFLSAAA